MDEETLKLEARVAALEVVTAHVAAIVLSAAKKQLSDVAAMRQSAAENLSKTGFAEMDPAMSDHWSAEVSDAVDRLLQCVELAWRSQSQEPPGSA